MAAIASTDVTITPLLVSKRSISSRVKEIECTIAFGNSTLTYPAGGVPLSTTLGAFGIALPVRQIELITPRNTTTGTHWYADVSTPSAPVLRGWHQGHTPQVIIEEVPTLSGTTTKTGTLAYPPAYIMAVAATVSGTIHALKVVPSTATLAAKEFGVNFTTGAFTTFAETVTVLTVTYVPQQPSGFFSAANMVSESITLATGNNNLTYRAGAFQNAYQTTATAANLTLAHVNASGVLAVDMVSSGNTVISAHSAQNAKAATFNYLKYSGLQQPGVEWIDQAAISLSSQAKEYGKTAGDLVGGLIIPAMGNVLINLETTNYTTSYMAASTATAAAGRAKVEWGKGPKITTAETAASTTLEDTALLFLSNLYTSHHGLAELTANHAPAATVLRAIIRF